MKLRLISSVMMLGVVVVIAACGNDSSVDENGDAAVRVVPITMTGMVFEPDAVQVRRGETVRFVFANDDTLTHDAFIGDKAAQDGHEMEMGSEGHAHGRSPANPDTDAVTVAPGGTSELTYIFHRAGELVIGCHQVGHYAAGMKATIDVVA